MPGPIFDPLNPNESPAMAYQRQLDKQNSGFSMKKKKDDKEPLTEQEKSIIKDEEDESDMMYGSQVFDPDTGKYSQMKKGGRVGNDYNQAAKNRPTSKDYKKKAAKYPCSHNRLY